METAPLSISLELGDVKTGIPILLNNHIGLAFVENIEEIKHEKGGGVKFKFKLAEECPTNDGKSVSAGFPVSQNVWFFDKNTPPDEIPERSKQTIARYLDAIFGTGDPGNTKGKPPRPALNLATVTEAIGKQVLLKFKAVPEGEYAGTEITGAYFPSDKGA